jgi:FlaA1/EpsC-like NDP-sugar epimerase
MKNFLKKFFLIYSDILIIIIGIWSAYSIRTEQFYSLLEIDFKVYALFIVVLIPIFYLTNIYQILLRYFDYHSVNRIIKSSITSMLVLMPINFFLYKVIFFPRSISIIAITIIGILLILHRIIINFIISRNLQLNKINNNILIFGVNNNIVDLIKNLRTIPSYGLIKGIIDNEDNILSKRELNGIKIYKKNELDNLIKKFSITEIIIGNNILKKKDFFNLFDKIKYKNIRLKNLSGIKNFIGKFLTESTYSEINFFDIVDRPKIKVDKKILKKNINNKNILITGGGGSIGGELCIEILKNNPKKIFILEMSEINLFNIINKIKEKKIYNNKIVKPILGDCNDKFFLESYFQNIIIDDVYHAAAYKHVSFGEENQYSMIKNNVFGTKTIVDFSTAKKVKNFVFISSDKAVNPKSILGFTKKFGEKIVCDQLIKNKNKIKTNFTIVRFGNVIGSSGSVIPIFLNQIRQNKPLTVTHKKVKRYFMSISEAVQLVINASYLNKKGIKIYALNMGKQIYIKTIAQRIIRLSGQTFKDSKNSKGDVPLKIIGLKKGEKLSEEITLGNNLTKTNHPMIMECAEKLNPKKKDRYLKLIENALKNKRINKNTFNFYKFL